MKKLLCGLTGLLLAAAAGARLPAVSDDTKAKVDQAKAKAAWGDKIAAYHLCLSQDRAALRYISSMKQQSREMKPAMAASACTDPGPFVPAALTVPDPAAPAVPAEKSIVRKALL
jgi:hypothetical protein